MKKIIYIANIRLPTEKAHGIQIMKMCEAFALAGIDVELVVPRRLNSIKQNPFEYYSVKENLKITKLPTLDLVRFGKIGFLVQSVGFAKIATLYSLFKKSDFIYSRDELPLYFLSFFKHNLFWETHTAKNNFVAKRVICNSKGMIAITQGLKDFYMKTYQINKNKILIASSSIDINRFNLYKTKDEIRKDLCLPVGKKIVGYVGKYKTMGESKGVKELVDSFAEILNKDHRVFLLLVGINKEELREVNNLFKKNDIDSNNYKIVCHIQTMMIPSYLKSCNVLIMSYPYTEHYAKYMSPVKMFEYMASEVPIVVSDLPSIREVLSENNSVLIELDSSKALIEGIKKVLRGSDFSDKIAKQAFVDVQSYTWEKRTKNILEFIK